MVNSSLNIQICLRYVCFFTTLELRSYTKRKSVCIEICNFCVIMALLDRYLLHPGFLFALSFGPGDGGDMFL